MSLVYMHTNLINGKAYVGWTTTSISRRWSAHLRAVRNGSNTMFHNAIRAYGEENWRHEVLEICSSDEEAKLAEVRLIKEHQTNAFQFPDKGYNMTSGGDGITGELVRRSNSTRKITHFTRTKMTSHRGRNMSENQKRHISEMFKGRKFSNVHKFHHKLAAERLSVRRMNSKLQTRKPQLILFVVGPDMCGKTNIISKLSDVINVKSFKASEEHETFLNSQDKFINDLRYADTRILDMIYQMGMSVIFDRGYPCERVYSEFYDRETDHKMLRFVDTSYAKLGALVLICTRKSFDNIQDDLDSRLSGSALQRISELYQDFANWTHCKTHTLYVDDENIDRELDEIISWLRLEGHDV